MKSKTTICVVVMLATVFGGWYYLHSRSKVHLPTGNAAATSATAEHKQPRSAAPLVVAGVSPQSLSANIQPVVTSGADYRPRIAAIRAITTNLAAEDLSALYSFLLKRVSEDDEQMGQVLKNQLMDKLCSLNPPPERLADLLAQLYHDQSQNEVLRDYAVQHLAAFCLQMELEPAEVVQSRDLEIQEAQNVLWEALGETQDSIAGTALLGLQRLVDSGASISEDQIGQAALKLANDESAGELTHITAYQMCAKLNVQSALPVIETAAQNGATIPAKISAIAALGLLGGANDVPLLQNLLSGSEERLTLPAKTAISRIEQRLQTSAR